MSNKITRSPSKNVSINSSMPNENFNGYYALFIGRYNDNTIYRSFMEFILPTLPKNYSITKVNLKFYILRNDTPNSEKKYRIYTFNDSFSDTKINYINQPKSNYSSNFEFIIKNEVNQYINLNLTKLIVKKYSSKQNKLIMKIQASSENTNSLVAFYSKDSNKKSYHPKLEIFLKKSDSSSQEKDNKSANTNLDSKAYYNMGNKYFEYEDYSSAAKYYENSFDSVEVDDLHYPLLCKKFSICLRNIDQHTKAINILNKAISHHPKYTDLYYLKGLIQYDLNRISLSLDCFKKCIELGYENIDYEISPGIGSYKAYYYLGLIYYELEDYSRACKMFCNSVKNNKSCIKSLSMIIKILKQIGRSKDYIKRRVESFFLSFSGSDKYINLAKSFINAYEYDIAYNYLSYSNNLLNASNQSLFLKGECMLFLKNYNKAFSFYDRINNKSIKTKIICRMALCKLLNQEYSKTKSLLQNIKSPNKNIVKNIYLTLINIYQNNEIKDKKLDKDNSKDYLINIIELLELLIRSTSPEKFEISLQLLNTVNNDRVLLELGKLYYRNEFYELSYNELNRSIKIFNKIDLEGLKMMYLSKLKTKNILDS